MQPLKFNFGGCFWQSSAKYNCEIIVIFVNT